MKHEHRAKIVENANLISQALEVAAKQYENDAAVCRKENAPGYLRVAEQFDKQAGECRELAEMFADMKE